MSVIITGTVYVTNEGREEDAKYEGGLTSAPFTDICFNSADVAGSTSRVFADATIITTAGLARVTLIPTIELTYITKWTYTFTVTGDATIYSVLLVNANDKTRLWIDLPDPLTVESGQFLKVVIRLTHTAG